MLNFIKKIIKNPEKFSEKEKLEMLVSVAEKEISPNELAEIIKFIKSKQAIKINLPDSIDICGTGGSWLARINTSTLACLKLAKMWIKVTKHWNKASSGRFGSFDLLEILWVEIAESTEDVLREYTQNNIAFLYAKKFYPFFKEFAEVRKKYAKPTIFNIIWPLLNPANADYQIIGCSFEDKIELMIETCKILWRKNVLIVRGEDWLDEVTLSDKTLVYELKDWKIDKYYITPEDFGLKTVNISEIMAEKIEDKIDIARDIIIWWVENYYNDLVDLNVKVALKMLGK